MDKIFFFNNFAILSTLDETVFLWGNFLGLCWVNLYIILTWLFIYCLTAQHTAFRGTSLSFLCLSLLSTYHRPGWCCSMPIYIKTCRLWRERGREWGRGNKCNLSCVRSGLVMSAWITPQLTNDLSFIADGRGHTAAHPTAGCPPLCRRRHHHYQWGRRQRYSSPNCQMVSIRVDLTSHDLTYKPTQT